jgi:hemolysin activation/secretion protein
MRLGRAHDSGAVTGDRGYGALVEVVWRPPLAGSDSRFQPPQWFVFADHAQGERLAGIADSATGGIQRMGSVGMGIRFALAPQFALETLVAKATNHVASTDPRPDPRLLVSLSGRF